MDANDWIELFRSEVTPGGGFRALLRGLRAPQAFVPPEALSYLCQRDPASLGAIRAVQQFGRPNGITPRAVYWFGGGGPSRTYHFATPGFVFFGRLPWRLDNRPFTWVPTVPPAPEPDPDAWMDYA